MKNDFMKKNKVLILLMFFFCLCAVLLYFFVMRDTQAPVIQGTKNFELTEKTTIDYKEGVTVTDNVDDNVKLDIDYSKVNLEIVGQYPVVYKAVDKAGNETSKEVFVTVKDILAPVIEGVKDQKIQLGDTISYKKGITVTDDFDSNVQLKVDTSKVNLKKPGRYQVTYIATDSSGNVTEKTMTLTVSQKNNLSTLDRYLERTLNQITNDSMTKKQKARAIYDWIKKNIRYSAPTPLGDYKVAALQTFKTHKGDCYGFFSIAKALLTAAEIENIDVIGTTVDHYWNLINCGEGWYHFDTTAGWNTDRFMWTDEQIANYNYVIPSTGYRLHYAWDQSKYPATPKK